MASPFSRRRPGCRPWPGHDGKRRLLRQHDVALAGEAREQVRPQRADDEQHGQTYRRDLREE